MRNALPFVLLSAAALAACDGAAPTDAARAPNGAAAARSANAPIYLVSFNEGVLRLAAVHGREIVRRPHPASPPAA